MNCPTRFDARTMTTDELQEILSQKLAQQDVVSEDPPPSPKPEKSEDFQADSE